MELIERILIAAVKRTPGASDQIGYAQTDDDGHQRGDELEAAHEILCVLHGAPSLMGIEPENRVANGWIYNSARVIPAREGSSPLPTANPLRCSNWRALRFRSDRYGRRQAVACRAFLQCRRQPQACD